MPENGAPGALVAPVPDLAAEPEVRPRPARSRRLWAVPAGVVALLLPHLAALSSAGADDAGSLLLSVLGTYVPVLALAAGGLMCCHWWFSELQGSGRASAAMLALGVATLPSQLGATEPGAPVWSTSPTYGHLVGVLALALASLTVLHLAEFRRRIQPLLLGAGVGLAFATFTSLATAGHLGSWALRDAPVGYLTLLAGLLTGLGALAALRRSGQPTWARRELQVATALLAWAWIVIHAGTSALAEGVAALIALTAMVLLTTTAAELVVRGFRSGSRTERTLSDRAALAEAQVREDEELLHEVRSTVAGINASTRILYQPGHEVTAVHQERLQYLLVHEIDRLHRMVSGHGEKPEVVDVDVVLNPLVSSFRYLGVEVDWNPGHATAFAQPSAIAEIVQILLTNAGRHAPGSTVRVATRERDGVTEIEVSNDGPAVPPADRERIFQRGARSATSRGHGLGLYIARRLAGQQGGSLTLDPQVTDGASFLVHLPLPEGDR